jgi:hypothetical protein
MNTADLQVRRITHAVSRVMTAPLIQGARLVVSFNVVEMALAWTNLPMPNRRPSA